MIVFDLQCTSEHAFEAWFPSSEAYDKQRKARKVVCPVCGDTRISKALMAPAVSGARKKTGGAKAPHAAGARDHMAALRELRRHIEANSDHVGERFPEEARKIHYGEAEQRSIHGEATMSEAEALRDEGIDCQRIPWVPDHDA